VPDQPSPSLPAVPEPPWPQLGLDPLHTQPALQQDVYKELVNKLAWVLGSVYRVPYGNRKSPPRNVALKLAAEVIKTQGYPRQIARPS